MKSVRLSGLKSKVLLCLIFTALILSSVLTDVQDCNAGGYLEVVFSGTDTITFGVSLGGYSMVKAYCNGNLIGSVDYQSNWDYYKTTSALEGYRRYYHLFSPVSFSKGDAVSCQIENYNLTSDENGNQYYKYQSTDNVSLEPFTGELDGQPTEDIVLSGGRHVIRWLDLCGTNLTVKDGAVLTMVDLSSSRIRIGEEAYLCSRFWITPAHPEGTSYGTGIINIDNATLDGVKISAAERLDNYEVSVTNSVINSSSLAITKDFYNNTGSDTTEKSSYISIRASGTAVNFSNNNMPYGNLSIIAVREGTTYSILNNLLGSDWLYYIFGNSSSVKSNGNLIIKDNIINGGILIEGLGSDYGLTIENNTISGKLDFDKIGDTGIISMPDIWKKTVIKNTTSGDLKLGNVSGVLVKDNTIKKTPPNSTSSLIISDQGTLSNGPSNYNEISGNAVEYGSIKISAVSYEIKGNKIYGNSSTTASLILGKVLSNEIYDNVFYLSSSGTISLCTDCTNVWNTDKTSDGNVISGPNKGGNFWDGYYGYTGTDADGDGIGDTPYQINANNIDDLPLVKPNYSLALSSGSSNPSSSSEKLAGKTMLVEHIKLSTDSGSSGNVSVSAMSFLFDGDGKASDITGASLYRDSSCSGSSTTQVGSTVSGGSTMTFSGLSETITGSGGYACYILKYQFGDKVSPCAKYGAKIVPAGITATSSGSEAKMGGGEVKGYLQEGYPEISIAGNATRNGSKKKTLSSPLVVKLDNVDSGIYSQWKARFKIDQGPSGASGQMFDNGSSNNPVTFNSGGLASTYFTAGDKPGSYIISATPEPVDSSIVCSGTPETETFTVNVASIDITSKNDGNTSDKYIGTFMTQVEAPNKFTAKVELPEGDTRKVSKVTFALLGKTIEDASDPYEAEFDMSDIKDGSKMLVTAVLDDGNKIEDEYPFSAIEVPDWIGILQKIAKNFAWQYQDDENNSKDRYHLQLTYPNDFDWKKLVPPEIPIIGGTENTAKASFTVEADYYIKETTAFTGKGTLESSILGRQFTSTASVTAEFDKYFKYKKATGIIGTETEFELPKKTLSKTVLVYGVPVTVALDVGGSVKVFVNGVIVYDDKLRFEKASLIPGTTLTLDLTASASAVFGLAKLGVKGSPAATLQIKISYTTKEGIYTDAFGGELEIPIAVVGSLFWGTVSGEVGVASLGPYSFGDEVSAASAKAKAKAKIGKSSISGKQYHSTSATATDQDGRKLIIWTKDTDLSDSAINPEVAYKIDSGSGWGEAALITSNDKWEIDPKATFLSNGTALSIWTSNKGDKGLSKLNQIFAAQDIAYAYYDGTNWEQEGLVINDSESDGSADMAYDSQSNKAVAVWVHNSNTTETVSDKSKWAIYYSQFDPTGKTWTTAAAVPGTVDKAADYMPSVASDSNGKSVAVWVKDLDGKLFKENPKVAKGTNTDTTNSDNFLYYSIFSGSGWSAVKKITTPGSYTKQMPDTTMTADGKIALVYVQKETGADKIYFSLYNPATDTWSASEEIESGNYLIEDPQITIDASGKATIIYRKHDGKNDALYAIAKDLSAGRQAPAKATASGWETPKRLTYDNGQDMWISASATPDGQIIMSSTSANTAGENIRSGLVETVRKAVLTKEYTEQAVAGSTGKYEIIELTAGLNVTTADTYVLKAKLYTSGGKFITEATGQPQELEAGTQEMALNFSGRRISASKEDGPYTIKDIVLLSTSGMSIAVDSDPEGTETAAYTFGQFEEARLASDKDAYIGTEQTATITVRDEKASGTVEVEAGSSTGEAPVIITLNETTAGVFEGTLKFSRTAGGTETLMVEDAGVLQFSYTDKDGENWTTSAAWRAGGPRISTSRGTYDFGNVLSGKTSDAMTVTVSNNGDSDLIVGTVALAGKNSAEFSLKTDNCSGQTLTSGNNCTVEIMFAPQTGGTKAAELTITSDDPNTPLVKMPLSGKSALMYNLTVYISGNGTGTVYAKGLTCSGGTCTGSYEKKGNAKVSVSLLARPAKGSKFVKWGGDCSSKSAACKIAEMAADKTVTVTIGKPDISVSATTIDAGSVTKGQTSEGQTLTITNSGDAELKIARIKITGDDAKMFSALNATTVKPAGKATLAAGGTQDITIKFKPTATGAKTTTVVISSDDPDEATVTIKLDGTGQ